MSAKQAYVRLGTCCSLEHRHNRPNEWVIFLHRSPLPAEDAAAAITPEAINKSIKELYRRVAGIFAISRAAAKFVKALGI